MINFGTLPFSESAKEQIRSSVNNYWRHARIEVSGKPEFDKDGVLSLFVELSQKELTNDKVLTEKELISRGEAIFDPQIMPEGQRVYIIGNTFDQ